MFTTLLAVTAAGTLSLAMAPKAFLAFDMWRSSSRVFAATRMTHLPTNDHYLQLPDSRTIGFREYGVRGSPKVVFCHHGMPGSRKGFEIYDTIAQKVGIRVIAVDRPGYGLSSPNLTMTVADVAKDVLLISDHLGIDRFAVFGGSGGGPYAFASAATFPKERLVSTLACAGVGPLDAIPNAFKGFGAAPSPYLFTHFPSLLASSMRLTTALQPLFFRNGQVPEFLLNALPQADADLIRSDPSLLFSFLESGTGGFELGGVGAYADCLLFASYARWGFTFEDIDGDITIVHGVDDVNVPLSHSQFAFSKLNGGRGGGEDKAEEIDEEDCSEEGAKTVVVKKRGKQQEGKRQRLVVLKDTAHIGVMVSSPTMEWFEYVSDLLELVRDG